MAWLRHEQLLAAAHGNEQYSNKKITAADLQPAGDALAVLQDGAVAPQKPPPEFQHLLPLVGRQLDCLQDVAVQLCRLLVSMFVSTS